MYVQYWFSKSVLVPDERNVTRWLLVSDEVSLSQQMEQLKQPASGCRLAPTIHAGNKAHLDFGTRYMKKKWQNFHLVCNLRIKLKWKHSAGTVLTDVRERQWVVGRPIGAGGFGAIYLGIQLSRFKYFHTNQNSISHPFCGINVGAGAALKGYRYR